MRRKKKAYLDDFQVNASGEYVYTGATYAYQAEKKSRRRAMIELWVLCSTVVLCTLACGCIPVPGLGGNAYVLIPYVAGLIAAGSVLWAMVELTAGGDPLREYVYKVTIKKLPLRIGLTAVCSCAALIGECVYLNLNGDGGKAVFAGLFLGLEGVSAAASVAFFVLQNHNKWAKCGNTRNNF